MSDSKVQLNILSVDQLITRSLEMLPKHGKIECRECYLCGSNKIIQPHIKWRMVNDPGAWGGNNPEYLVLGFSKGSTQADIYQKGNFEDIAFAGMRSRLTEALQVVGALSANETSDEKIKDSSSNMAFGSLIRCSVSRLDKSKKNIYTCSGSLIIKSFSEIPDIIDTCTRKYLTNLPSSVKAIFFLGNSDSYVEECQKLLSKHFPDDFEKINSMAVTANSRLWIHLSHPSPANAWFNSWLTDGETKTGLKRTQAAEAMQSLLNSH